MNKIDFPRTAYDGTKIDRKSLEDWYCKKIESKISAKLKGIKAKRGKETLILNLVCRNLHKIILSSPRDLEYIANKIPKNFFRINDKEKSKMSPFGEGIRDAFNYMYYRKNVLVELAQKLNVKSCPYCNMSYTLFAEDGKQKLAKLQFDHFFDKSEYPFLSMSLYNLIPSCAVCNQGKSTGHLSLNYHPYESAISDKFHFRVVNPLELFVGAKIDKIEIDLVEDRSSRNELKEYDDMFHIKSLYQRHRDVAQEVFDKAFQEKYYILNPFPFWNNKSYRLRRVYGTYINESEIEKRPLSKFVQDIREQALGNKKP